MDILAYTTAALGRALGTAPDPAAAGVVASVEAALGVRLPDDVPALAAAFPGGVLFDYRQFPWDPADPSGVVANTRRLRAEGLRPADVALGTAGNRLYFWQPSEVGAGHINSAPLAEDPPVRPRRPLKAGHYGRPFYMTYTGLLLEQMEAARYETVRANLEKLYPNLTKKAARKWRHRWAPHEVDTIERSLERGVSVADRLPTFEDGGREFVDLRGAVVDPTRKVFTPAAPQHPARPVRFERVDFSFGLWSLKDVDAHDCRFRAATLGCFDSRFTNCDFTFVDVEGANQPILRGHFTDCNFTGGRLAESMLYGTFERCDFTGVDLRSASLEHVTLTSRSTSRFIDCTWTDCRFGGDARQWDPMRPQAFPDLGSR